MADQAVNPAELVDRWLLQLMYVAPDGSAPTVWLQQLAQGQLLRETALACIAQMPLAQATYGFSWTGLSWNPSNGVTCPLKAQAQAWVLLLEASRRATHIPLLLSCFESFWEISQNVQVMAYNLHILASNFHLGSAMHIGDIMSTVLLLKLASSRFFLDRLLVAHDAKEPRGLGACAAMQHLTDILLRRLVKDEAHLAKQLKHLKTGIEHDLDLLYLAGYVIPLCFQLSACELCKLLNGKLPFHFMSRAASQIWSAKQGAPFGCFLYGMEQDTNSEPHCLQKGSGEAAGGCFSYCPHQTVQQSQSPLHGSCPFNPGSKAAVCSFSDGWPKAHYRGPPLAQLADDLPVAYHCQTCLVISASRAVG